MCSGLVIGSCVTKAQGWGGKALVLGDGSRNFLFSRFQQPPFDKYSKICLPWKVTKASKYSASLSHNFTHSGIRL